METKAATNTVSTLSRLEEGDWAEVKELPLLSNVIFVKHTGISATTLKNNRGAAVTWLACILCILGNHENLYVNGIKRKCDRGIDYGKPYASLTLVVKPGQVMKVSVNN